MNKMLTQKSIVCEADFLVAYLYEKQYIKEHYILEVKKY
ncbi:hypothetical protein FHX91_004077 [Clostridium saccharobutylicum]|nr:hypothetical protein [Clostridium saccharobutylicum]MBA8997792.1 hypothetical protein [Clostridium saccharobutylicum]NOV54620.1 hypothetical protein [Clostridium saccharobutylicum]NOV74611.1 hypothetical protein [Clostridium saccharobutylicum]NOV79124.1 hypothetical protein [Clostridium saccharobutylicum]